VQPESAGLSPKTAPGNKSEFISHDSPTNPVLTY
jgi:hypothetical protein